MKTLLAALVLACLVTVARADELDLTSDSLGTITSESGGPHFCTLYTTTDVSDHLGIFFSECGIPPCGYGSHPECPRTLEIAASVCATVEYACVTPSGRTTKHETIAATVSVAREFSTSASYQCGLLVLEPPSPTICCRGKSHLVRTVSWGAGVISDGLYGVSAGFRQ